jgi:hypothetical protein
MRDRPIWKRLAWREGLPAWMISMGSLILTKVPNLAPLSSMNSYLSFILMSEWTRETLMSAIFISVSTLLPILNS